MKSPAEIIDAQAVKAGMVTPVGAEFPLNRAFVVACIVAAVAARDAEWRGLAAPGTNGKGAGEQQSIQTPERAREQAR